MIRYVMAFNPMTEPGFSNPIYPFIFLTKHRYHILICQTCQYACLAGEIATHLAEQHVGIDQVLSAD
jgi:hypothetical protein